MRLKYLALVGIAFSTAAVCQTATLTPAQRAEGEAMVQKTGGLLADTLRDTDGTKFREVHLQTTIGEGGKPISRCAAK